MKGIECQHWKRGGDHFGSCAINKYKNPSHGVCVNNCKIGNLIEISVPIPASKISAGPGTELTKLIHSGIGAWLRQCGGCAALADQMDAWGPDKCLYQIDEIERIITENAKKNGWLSKLALKAGGLKDSWTVRAFILQAIDNARRNQMVIQNGKIVGELPPGLLSYSVKDLSGNDLPQPTPPSSPPPPTSPDTSSAT